ncbi:FAD-dependent oxidoreductase [Anopheles sinensis]|uniref:FAD-dependent oxidoreductase n=1 Tax=Anopheles sinensis TaxID=74873 RepID=A0A084WI38_ANOSI|nr:FAD-dependent oxidoreductase [Anopheles sinensis]
MPPLSTPLGVKKEVFSKEKEGDNGSVTLAAPFFEPGSNKSTIQPVWCFVTFALLAISRTFWSRKSERLASSSFRTAAFSTMFSHGAERSRQKANVLGLSKNRIRYRFVEFICAISGHKERFFFPPKNGGSPVGFAFAFGCGCMAIVRLQVSPERMQRKGLVEA